MRNLVLTLILIGFVGTLTASAQADLLYVVSPQTDSLLVFDPASETVVETISVGEAPIAAALNAQTGRVFVANHGDNTVSVIDSSTNEVIETIALAEPPISLSLNEAENRVTVTLADSEFVMIDGESLDVLEAEAPAARLLRRPGPVFSLTLPSYPLCPLNAAAAREVFQTNLTPGLIDLQCRMLAAHGEYIQPPAEIGIQEVIDLGVIHAVDLFSPSGANMKRIDVCMLGRGHIIFIDSAGQPHRPELLQRSFRAGYTCAQLPNTGTIILVP